MITPDDVRRAAKTIEGVAHRTPVVRSRTLGEGVVIKPENLQRVGAFKFRGAYNKISSCRKARRLLRIVRQPCSGCRARVAAAGCARDDPHARGRAESKLAATRGYGAHVVTYDRYTGNREEIAGELAGDDAHIVPPYDDELIMAGAGTAALELIEDAGAVDTLVVPVGGGGLISGCATIAKEFGVARVVGVEPAAGDDWAQSFALGERVEIAVPHTIADGLQTHAPGALTWEVGRRLVDEIVTVTDAQIVEAMRFAFERLKLVAEPSGAVGIAAVLQGLVRGDRIGVIVSGGNVSAERFAELL